MFDRRSSLAGIAWNPEAQLRTLREELGPFVAQFAADPEGVARPYTVANPSYGVLDAAVLYAMIRARKPGRILELGSGASTRVAAAAARANAADGAATALSVRDPFAGGDLDTLAGISDLVRVPAQEIALREFECLDAGDVLFIDTTHTVKLGSDVNHLVLEILPRLPPGVLVHIHDVFIPFEYPRVWPEDFGLYWSEQYLVQAFLALNPSYAIVAGLGGLCRGWGDELAAALPGLESYDGSALWLMRVA